MLPAFSIARCYSSAFVYIFYFAHINNKIAIGKMNNPPKFSSQIFRQKRNFFACEKFTVMSG